MSLFDIISVPVFGIMVGLWVLYLVEGFKQNPGQGLLTLVVPFYVFYFAFIRSGRSPVIGVALTGLTALLVMLNTVKHLV